MTAHQLRIALVSDLHAFQPSETRKQNTSNLPTSPTGSQPDPFRDLKRLIDSDAKVRANLLVCPGDICDKADASGFQYAWTKLHELKEQLAATSLIATCGNHDLDSRHSVDPNDDPDPKGFLQTVSPQFPLEDDLATNHFWARNFVLQYPIPGMRALILNTSAFHGGKSDEYTHGRVSRRTIAAIKQAISKDTNNCEVNLLVCHHHLNPLQGYGTSTDSEYVSKGGELLDALSDSTGLPWLILHGHRHIPHLKHSHIPHYVMIGASSFSKPEVGHLNQFHLIDLVVDTSSVTDPIRGIINSWTWSPTSGWTQISAGKDEGFPSECGFGFLGTPTALALNIEANVPAGQYVLWDEIKAKLDAAKYLPPSAQRQLVNILNGKGITISYDEAGRFHQIGRT